MSEAFLSRWSRLKKTGVEAEVAPAPFAVPIDAEKTPLPAAQNAPNSEEIPPDLPSIESLTNESDFAAFMQPKVPDALKRQALKKLFAQPQFNVMDGLDVYVDDYSVSVPIPDDWYKDIPSWQAMLNPKPPMVVTDGGYAVEADSEEGLATLAARAEKDSLAKTESDVKNEVESMSSDLPSPLPLSRGERGSSLAAIDTEHSTNAEDALVANSENQSQHFSPKTELEIKPDPTKPKQ
jgi:Protein of unknown function (DUF3306)